MRIMRWQHTWDKFRHTSWCKNVTTSFRHKSLISHQYTLSRLRCRAVSNVVTSTSPSLSTDTAPLPTDCGMRFLVTSCRHAALDGTCTCRFKATSRRPLLGREDQFLHDLFPPFTKEWNNWRGGSFCELLFWHYREYHKTHQCESERCHKHNSRCIVDGGCCRLIIWLFLHGCTSRR